VTVPLHCPAKRRSTPDRWRSASRAPTEVTPAGRARTLLALPTTYANDFVTPQQLPSRGASNHAWNAVSRILSRRCERETSSPNDRTLLGTGHLSCSRTAGYAFGRDYAPPSQPRMDQTGSKPAGIIAKHSRKISLIRLPTRLRRSSLRVPSPRACARKPATNFASR
jgi:hypothetical protein